MPRTITKTLVASLAAVLLAAPALASAGQFPVAPTRLAWIALLMFGPQRHARVEVNIASADQIRAAVPELTPAAARNIVAWRERKGRYHSVLDLLDVPGVDPEVITRNRARLLL